MTYRRIILSLLLMLSLQILPGYSQTTMKEMQFSPIMEFKNGDNPQELLWITEPDGTPNIGVLQCPMAYVTLPDGKIWIADTQNARICLFSKEGKNLKEIDLIQLGKKAGLEDPPAIVDICLSSNKIIAGDAASNSVLEINPDNLEMRIFPAPSQDKGGWFQISHLYTDDKQRIYIDDLALGKIIILDKDGKYLGSNTSASISVSKNDSRMASINYVEETDGEAEASYYQIRVNKDFSDAWSPIANINLDDEKIMYINIIGIDDNNDIYVLYFTEINRYYKVFSMTGELKKYYVTAPTIPTINPASPDWIDNSGNIYTVTVIDKTLKILKLQ